MLDRFELSILGFLLRRSFSVNWPNVVGILILEFRHLQRNHWRLMHYLFYLFCKFFFFFFKFSPFLSSCPSSSSSSSFFHFSHLFSFPRFIQIVKLSLQSVVWFFPRVVNSKFIMWNELSFHFFFFYLRSNPGERKFF